MRLRTEGRFIIWAMPPSLSLSPPLLCLVNCSCVRLPNANSDTKPITEIYIQNETTMMREREEHMEMEEEEEGERRDEREAARCEVLII